MVIHFPFHTNTMKTETQHFLIVSYAAQGHINPARHLARRLAGISGNRVTVSIGLSAHRKLFPSSVSVGKEETEGLISYIPYADGADDGKRPGSDAELTDYFSRLKLFGTESLSDIVSSLSTQGRPVTCIIYTILLSWAVDVANDFNIPSVPFWVQPATVFAVFYRYFHGASDLISSHKNDPDFPIDFPGLPPLRIKDLPSFLVRDRTNTVDSSIILSSFEEMFRAIDRETAKMAGRMKPMVLVNTFDSLESDVVLSLEPEMKLVAVGPLVDDTVLRNDIYPDDSSGGYMEWLETQKEKSVVYVSFGSIAALPKRQLEEFFLGLEESGRPYLWVVRKDAKEKLEGGGIEFGGGRSSDNGRIVEWCNQVRVLSHRSVGCFVTHCGWNSTVESIKYGVPTVMLPQFADQTTITWLVEDIWGKGVEMKVERGGVAGEEEMKRCLDLVMSGGERGMEMRRNAEMWKEIAREASEDGGPSDRNLEAFVDEIRTFGDPIIE